jgi:AAA15 family ATPase/GTPase
MLRSISIKHFRAFQALELGPLNRVNLILGQNNAGKTAVLEALALLLRDEHDARGPLPAMFRPVSGASSRVDFPTGLTQGDTSLWPWFFYNKDRSKPAEVHGDFERLGKFGIILKDYTVSSPGAEGSPLHLSIPYTNAFAVGGRSTAGARFHAFSTFPSDPRQDAIDFNRVVIRRRKKQVEALLQKIEPRLQSIESLQTGNEPLLYADIGLSELIPVTQLGQGFNRLLDIYSELVASEARVLLIDEIENGLHYSVLKTVWSGLYAAASEMDVQIFATTHSWECVLAADEAASKRENYELTLIRLDRVDDEIKGTVIDQQALETAKQLHWEMR